VARAAVAEASARSEFPSGPRLAQVCSLRLVRREIANLPKHAGMQGFLTFCRPAQRVPGKIGETSSMRHMGSPFIKLAFFLDEGRSVAVKNPDVDGGRLLVDNEGNDSGYAAELNVNAVLRCFVANASNGDRIFWSAVRLSQIPPLPMLGPSEVLQSRCRKLFFTPFR
jgi:hypothetical protein